MTEKDITRLIRSDPWMMGALRAARKANLPDWMIGAGFVRAKVWDHLHGYTERTELTDLDLIYYDPYNLKAIQEWDYDNWLRELFPAPWETKNQARMALVNGEAYSSSVDGLAHWIETATCIAVRMGNLDELYLIAPYGIDDLVNMRLRPTPFERARSLFPERMAKKKWMERWPKLEIAVDKPFSKEEVEQLRRDLT